MMFDLVLLWKIIGEDHFIVALIGICKYLNLWQFSANFSDTLCGIKIKLELAVNCLKFRYLKTFMLDTKNSLLHLYSKGELD